ncbi:Omega-amidase [Chlorella vulgaris]
MSVSMLIPLVQGLAVGSLIGVAARRASCRLPALRPMASCASATTNVISTPPAQEIKVALCQLPVGANKAANIATARIAIEEAATAGADLVVLPEMWNCPYSNDSFPTYAEDVEGGEGQSPSTSMLAAAAADNRVVLVGGSIPERAGGRLYNTCFVYGRDGRLLGRHRKVGRLGIGICYDIRFPELAMLYAARGVQLIVYPGAFNMTTGPVHWELLQRARAVDGQLFVATCSPARSEEPGYTAWGHSTAVGPFAEILATTDEKPGIVYCEMDLAQVEQRRTNMPLQYQKRADLYSLLDLTRECKRCHQLTDS